MQSLSYSSRIMGTVRKASTSGATTTWSDAAAWRAVATRDASADGRVFYAVTSTGVYCRPSCPSRRPRRENVRFFASPSAAEHEGFRACRRCRPNDLTRSAESVARAKEILDRHAERGAEGNVSLGELAAAVGMSPFHLQRVFQAQLGLSPARYLRAQRGERFKSQLRRGGTVSRATYDAGFGSSSRAYEVAESQLGMTPATYRQGGAGAEIRYRVVRSSLGKVLVAATTRGVCAVKLGDDADLLERELADEYPRATLVRARGSDDEFGAWVEAIVHYVDRDGESPSVPVDVKATAFQWKVWRALQAIPRGETRSYTEVAAAIGKPGAVRAVASACASNRVALVIPCHRVVRSDGALSGYRWGPERKRELLQRERSATNNGAR
ncbi:MAG TPA: bifunctional DNA-binding transcriptional regulator/O6-methylguanine-DNA methyltransferase Ada [Gemmatimonadaceae bacterium]